MGLLETLFGGGDEPPVDPRQPHPPSLAEFFNPLSQPPGAPGPTPGPTLGDVLIPPPGNSPVQPPSLMEFLNPFSQPPGAQQPPGPQSMAPPQTGAPPINMADAQTLLGPPPAPAGGPPPVPERPQGGPPPVDPERIMQMLDLIHKQSATPLPTSVAPQPLWGKS